MRFVVGDIQEPASDGPFDAIIGRLALMYVPDPASVCPEDPQARELYLRVETAIADTMTTRGHVYDYGRRLPARLAAAGLVELGAEGRMLLRRARADATVARLTDEQLKVEVLATGALTQGDFEAYAQLLESPAFLAQSAIMIAAWGHRPG